MPATGAGISRRRFWSRCKSSILAPPKYGGGSYGGLPTECRVPSLHNAPQPYAAPPYAAPPYAASPLQPVPMPMPMPPQRQLPPSPMSQQQSPRHSLASSHSVEEAELMQLALAMSMSDAAAQSEQCAATPSPRDRAPPLRRHSQPVEAHASHQRRHRRRAETLSDEALARALGDMHDEEFAREQQLRELQGAEQHALPPLLSATPSGAPPAAHSPRAQQAGAASAPLMTPRPGGAQPQPPLRLGGTLGTALGAGFRSAAPPLSADCVGPPGFGRSLAPLLPRSGTVHVELLNPPPTVPQLPAAICTAPPAVSHYSGASSQNQPPPSPPAAGGASSGSRAAFQAADAPPPPHPPQVTSAALSAAGPGGAVVHDNPLGSFDGTVTNPLRAPQTAVAVEAGSQHSSVHSADDSTTPDSRGLAQTASSRQPQSSLHDDLLAQQAHAEQLPDLIQLQSPEPQPPLPAASAMQGVGLRLTPPVAAQISDLRAASWPRPAVGSSHSPASAINSHQRAGNSDPGGLSHISGLAGCHGTAVATAGPLAQGAAALPPHLVADDSLQAQAYVRHEQQQAWWAQQQPRREEQPQQEAMWRRQWQQGTRQPQWTQAASSSHDDDTQRNPVAETRTSLQDQRQQDAQLPAALPQQGCAGAQQHAQGASNAGDADCSGGQAAGSSGPAAGSGALWSAFFDFPEDSDLTDCHPALLQAARLQQEAAATIAAAAAEGPPGRISQGHWRAMHLDIAEAYTCPITQEVTEDPVIAADSFTYERSAIAAWLRNHDTSPMTNAQLPTKELIPNVAARSAIRTLQEAGLLDGAADD